MERLTERTALGILVKENYKKETLKTLYSCYGEKPNSYYSNCEEGYCAMEKLADYEDLEEQGLLLRLPISEDAPVYSIEYCCGKNKSNRSGMCFRGFCENCSDKAYYIRESVAKQCSICEINKSVFFTREEAEAKLKEMEKRKELKICLCHVNGIMNIY